MLQLQQQQNRRILIIYLVMNYIYATAASSGGDNCNEFVCGSVVSKCLLTQSCQCKLNDCHCCKDCRNCLGDLYTECCSCLDMCPKHNETLSVLAPKSQIGDFDGVPELFETLTADEDEEQWTTLRFPMRANLKRLYEATIKPAIGLPPASSVNCTVIYWNACTSNNKCLQYCESMGSTSYRWFHDGCCECVGANCYNYGINESRCIACPEDDEPELDALNDDEYGDANEEEMESQWVYGENEMN